MAGSEPGQGIRGQVYVRPIAAIIEMTTAQAVAGNNNRVNALFALRHYWERLFSRLKPFRQGGQHAIAQDELEREISVINEENHALAEEVQRVRSDFEHARDEENNKIVDLDRVRQAMQLAREEDKRKLAELESINDRYAAAREADHRKISELEGRLAGLEDERRQARDRVQTLESTQGPAVSFRGTGAAV